MKTSSPDIDYRALFHSLSDGVVYGRTLFDEHRKVVDYEYLDVNDSFEQLTGLRKVVGKKASTVVRGIVRSNPELFEAIGRVSLTGHPETLELHVQALDKWFRISASSRQTGYFTAIFQNISDQKLMVNKLERAKLAARNVLSDLAEERDTAQTLVQELKKFKSAVDNVSEHILITDSEGVVLFANHAVERITGFSLDELVGTKASDTALWKGRMPKEFYPSLWRTIKDQKKTFIGEIIKQRKNGEEYFASTSITPILNSKGEVSFFVDVERDVTKEKEINRAKSEFVSLASHQLRTPLTGIAWTIELFARKEKLSKRGKEYLNDILFSVHRASELIKLLLNTSRIESGSVGVHPESVDLADFIEKHMEGYRLLCEKRKLTITYSHHGKLMAITDLNLLEYILQNLVTNSINYTSVSGTIALQLERKDKDALMHVRDTGIGIPKKEQERIFEKFMRASNAIVTKTDGTGLGLYIAQEAAKLLGGTIWFESEEGKGSTFFVRLPLVSQPVVGAKGLARA